MKLAQTDARNKHCQTDCHLAKSNLVDAPFGQKEFINGVAPCSNNLNFERSRFSPFVCKINCLSVLSKKCWNILKKWSERAPDVKNEVWKKLVSVDVGTRICIQMVYNYGISKSFYSSTDVPVVGKSVKTISKTDFGMISCLSFCFLRTTNCFWDIVKLKYRFKCHDR